LGKVFLFRKDAAVLLLSLWSLSFLTILAVSIGLGARQRIVMLKRLESRSQVRAAVQAGAKKAIAVLTDDVETSGVFPSLSAKLRRHNNSSDFSEIMVAGLKVQVDYQLDPVAGSGFLFGLADEQAKINLNTSDRTVLSRLLSLVLGLMTDEAQTLADDILDWRDYGMRSAQGFFSDSYYQNLDSPYPMKESPFERLDELLLVKGMNAEKFRKLAAYLTIYGNGRVNINTASRTVLLALGLEAMVTDRILQARRGKDGLEATADDHIFLRSFDVAADVGKLVGLEEDSARQIDALNSRGIIGVESTVYSFRSRTPDAENAEIFGVLDVLTGKVELWVQK
jgi:type II secretory pathway component PulK